MARASIQQHGLLFVGLVVMNALLTATYMRPDVLSNDDFYLDPGHLYVKDARYAVIPFLTLVDYVFPTQYHAKTLGWILMSLAAAAAALSLIRLLQIHNASAVGLATFTSLALLTVPNYFWAPALWYNAFAFLGLGIAFMAQDAMLRGARWGTPVWVVATLATFWSYQPFALIALGLWVIRPPHALSAMTGAIRVPWARVLLPPFFAVAIAAGTKALVSIVVPSPRLQSLWFDGVGDESLVSTLMFSYGRPLQVALVVALSVSAVGLLALSFVFVKRRNPYEATQALFLLAAGGLGMVVSPFVLSDGSLERFATALQLVVLIVWGASLSHSIAHHVTPEEARSMSVVMGVTAVVVAVLGGLGLTALNQPRLAGVVVLAVALSMVLLAVVVAAGFVRSASVLALAVTLGPILLALSLTRSDLTDRWISLEADRAVMGEIVMGLSALDFERGQDVTVELDIQGEVPWYSPLFRRVAVGGTEVVQEFASAISPWNVTVIPASTPCPSDLSELVTVVSTDDSSALVCVSFGEAAPAE